jgi:hypothetical protein
MFPDLGTTEIGVAGLPSWLCIRPPVTIGSDPVTEPLAILAGDEEVVILLGGDRFWARVVFSGLITSVQGNAILSA